MNQEDGQTDGTALATFAAGCFWGVEDSFRKVKGVRDVTAGYTGGTAPAPTYEMVCSNGTGHAEAVRVEYDPSVVSYSQLLDAFWNMHDPTQLDRQGPDIGSQYRSVVFYHDSEQRRLAEESRQKLETSGRHRRSVVTRIEPAGDFWPAEEYHQRYFEKNRLRRG